MGFILDLPNDCSCRMNCLLWFIFTLSIIRNRNINSDHTNQFNFIEDYLVGVIFDSDIKKLLLREDYDGQRYIYTHIF